MQFLNLCLCLTSIRRLVFTLRLLCFARIHLKYGEFSRFFTVFFTETEKNEMKFLATVAMAVNSA